MCSLGPSCRCHDITGLLFDEGKETNYFHMGLKEYIFKLCEEDVNTQMCVVLSQMSILRDSWVCPLFPRVPAPLSAATAGYCHSAGTHPLQLPSTADCFVPEQYSVMCCKVPR